MKRTRTNQWLRILAALLSRVFDPVLIIPLILTGVVSLAYLNGYRWGFLLLVFVMDGVVPGVYLVTRFIRNRGRDWDIHSRDERVPLFVLTVLTHGVTVMVAFLLERHPLAEILLGLWLMTVVFTGITMVWKISVHAGVNATLATMVMYLVNQAYWWVWLVVPVVGWARIYGKLHDWKQVVAGGILPPILLTLYYRLMGVV